MDEILPSPWDKSRLKDGQLCRRAGSVEKGKFADLIAVAGNPLTDISEMQRVRFVMKGGFIVKKDI